MASENARLVGRLRSCNKRYDLAQVVFGWAATRRSAPRETSVDELMTAGRLDRAEAVAVLKELARIGCGAFVVGRRKAKSRIRWYFSLSSIGRVAKGLADELEEIVLAGWAPNGRPISSGEQSCSVSIQVKGARASIMLSTDSKWLLSLVRSAGPIRR